MVLKAAGFIIYRKFSEEIEYLLLQTSYGHHHWTPPKGHVDPGESEFNTAARETQEESGLRMGSLLIKQFTRTLKYDVEDKKKEVVYWLAQLIDKDAKIKLSSEHQDYKWVPLKEACELANFQDMQEMLQECQKFIEAR